MNTQWTISIVAALIAGPSCLATDIHVPADQPTIQAGINAASNGDTVIVADGQYAAAGDYNLVISGKTITVRSASGSPGCRIICPGTGNNLGFYITSNNSTIRGFTIENGTAGQSGDGGAMKCSGGSPKIISCVFKYNSASIGGGAVSCMSGTTATFLACSFIGNSAIDTNGKGGAVYVNGASPTFVNCLLLGNLAATEGGGIHGKNSANISLINCTLAANELDAGAGVEGTAVSLAGSTLTMTNSIVWDNIGPVGADVLYADGTSTQTVSYSDVQVVVSGTGNISVDPLFVTSAGNLRLQAASPCINIVGGGGAVPADASDVDGDSDVAEATPDLDWDQRVQYDLVDMGCYEHRCAGDIESDCLVDSYDFTAFVVGLSDWSDGAEYEPCPAYSAADVNRDCQVNFDDLVLFFASWGECPNGCGMPKYPGDPDLEDDTWWKHYATPSGSGDLLVELFSAPDASETGDPEAGDFTAKGTFGTRKLLLRAADTSDNGDESDLLHDAGTSSSLNIDVTVDPTPTSTTTGVMGDQDDMPPFGFDVTYVVTNPTSGALDLPTFIIPDIQLDATILGNALAHGTHFKSVASGATDTSGYPSIRYSPIAIGLGTVTQIISSQTFSFPVSVGVSVLYPVLQYQHEMAVYLENDSGTDDTWKAVVKPWADRDQTAAAVIPGGATRTYKVCVRFMLRDEKVPEDPEHWIYTLEPYRHYFWKTYGNKAKYEQDLRPVWGINCADCSNYNSMNPRAHITYNWDGVWQHSIWQDGWCAFACRAKYYLQNIGNQERIMLWKPSGLYNFVAPPAPSGQDCSSGPWPLEEPEECCWTLYPPQIMTTWSAEMEDTKSELTSIIDDVFGSDPDVDLGFWWGFSSKHAHVSGTWDGWLDPELEPLDPLDPDHVLAAYAEMEAAYGLTLDAPAGGGPLTMGMDSIRQMDVWDTLPWIERLRQDFPDTRFIAEPHCCDILHMHMPFATLDTNLNTLTGSVPHAPLLSDYLVPGRETWLILQTGTIDESKAKLMIGWGLTPVTYACIDDVNMYTLGDFVCAAALNNIDQAWNATSPGTPTPTSGNCALGATNPYTDDPYTVPSSAPADCDTFTGGYDPQPIECQIQIDAGKCPRR